MKNLHPGIILRDSYMGNTSVTEMAKNLDITRTNLSRILNQKASISVEMAIKLAKFFKNTPEFWLTLQMKYDLWKAQKNSK